MEKLGTDQHIQHFSHQHLLRLLNIQNQNLNAIFLCSCCKLEASEWAYFCIPCNFCLHRTCSNMPRELNHDIDPRHTLTLISTPAYPEGAFSCNACGKLGTGFSYHCGNCQLDLHAHCAFAPSPLAQHVLFDKPSIPVPQQQENYYLRRQLSPGVSIATMPGPASFVSGPSPSVYFLNYDPGAGLATRTFQTLDHGNCHPSMPSYTYPEHRFSQQTNRSENNLMGHVVQGFVEGLAQQAGAAIFQGLIGN